jgi:uncharacterized protein
MNPRRCLAPLLFALAAIGTSAQTVEVNRQNRTIELTAQGSIEVEADLVSITVGYHSWGPTHDAAHDDNARVAAQILKAWTDAGVAAQEISTLELSSNETSAEDLRGMSPAERAARQYEAMQSWRITAKPEVAQMLLDLAISAGANDLNNPVWQISNESAADARAYAAALEQAHTVAEQMAKSFGATVGSLLYATNQNRGFVNLAQLATVETSAASVGPAEARKWPPLHPIKLLPQKLDRSATVRAIFALE